MTSARRMRPTIAPVSGVEYRRVTTRVSFQVIRDADASSPIGQAVHDENDAAALARQLIGAEMCEMVLALWFDSRQRLTGYTEIARGTLNAARFQPRDVLVPACLNNAHAFVLAHNHPSQDAEPSRADRQVTRAMRDAARLVGIMMLDHVIVTDETAYSFRASERWE